MSKLNYAKTDKQGLAIGILAAAQQIYTANNASQLTITFNSTSTQLEKYTR